VWATELTYDGDRGEPVISFVDSASHRGLVSPQTVIHCTVVTVIGAGIQPGEDRLPGPYLVSGQPGRPIDRTGRIGVLGHGTSTVMECLEILTKQAGPGLQAGRHQISNH
jgi:hypothetical protein